MVTGRTAGELRATMTQEELGLYVAYMEENGPFNPMLRLEMAIARGISPFMGRGYKPKDWMLWPKVEKKPSLEEWAARLKVASSQNKRRDH